VLLSAIFVIWSAWVKRPLASMMSLRFKCLACVLLCVFLDSFYRLETSANTLGAKCVRLISYSSLLQLNRILQLSEVTKLDIPCYRNLYKVIDWPVFGGTRSLWRWHPLVQCISWDIPKRACIAMSTLLKNSGSSLLHLFFTFLSSFLLVVVLFGLVVLKCVYYNSS